MNNDFNNNNFNNENNGTVQQTAPVWNEAPIQVNTQPAETVSAKKCMVLGIVGLALSELGIPGIIVGAIGKKNAARFAEEHGGQVFGPAKVGRILSKVAVIVGIVMTVFWVFYAIIMAVSGFFLVNEVAKEIPNITNEIQNEFMAIAGQLMIL